MNLVVQLTKFLDFLLIESRKYSFDLNDDVFHAIFVQALIFSFGSSLVDHDRLSLENSIKYLSGLPTNPSAKSGQLPMFLFDYLYQVEFDRWISWEDLVPTYQYDRAQRFTEIFVPTVDTVRLGNSI